VTERRRVPPPSPAEPGATSWDQMAICDALVSSLDAKIHALPSPTPNEDDGTGVGAILGDPPRALLELYPSQQRVSLRIPGVRLELEGVGPPAINPEGVIFERNSPSHTLSLALSRRGELELLSTPVSQMTTEGPQIVTAAPDGTERPIPGPDPETTSTAHSGAPDEASNAMSPTRRREDKEAHQERVRIYGRLATDVRFKTHAAGRLIGEFVLAERVDEEQTKFHKVAAFDNPETERFVASKLKQLVEAGELGRGRPASVVGYRHESERKKRDGTTTTEEQIYAVTIAPR
jgi:hypothetical protein